MKTQIVNKFNKGGYSSFSSYKSESYLRNSLSKTWILNKSKNLNGIATFNELNEVYCPDGSTYALERTNQCVWKSLAAYYLNVYGSYSDNQLVKFTDLSRKVESSTITLQVYGDVDFLRIDNLGLLPTGYSTLLRVGCEDENGNTGYCEGTITKNGTGVLMPSGWYPGGFITPVVIFSYTDIYNAGYSRPGYDKKYNIVITI